MNGKEINIEKEITLADILEVTKRFISGDFSEEAFNEYGKSMSIRSYIPIFDKGLLLFDLVTNCVYGEESSPELRVTDLHRLLFFKILLGEYGLIDCEDTTLWTYSNYDLLYPIFAPFLLSYCESDYKAFESMLRETLIVYGYKRFSDILYNIDSEMIQESSESNKELLTELTDNKEIIQSLSEILKINNPLTTAIAEGLKNQAQEKAAKIK